MKILVTNDDGIFAEGLWALATELKNIGQVVVVAPDREQSATGTAVTLHHPLRSRQVRPPVPEIEAHAVQGTPADCVILALGKLVTGKIDMVVSGINAGTNLGEDVLISGTVGAALQGYLRGLPALAFSSEATDSRCLDIAAELATLLVKRIDTHGLKGNIFLNVNLPNLPLAKIKGIKITRLASRSHTDSVEERNDGKQKYYWLIRQRTNQAKDEKTDMWAIEQGNISITPLHIRLPDRPSPTIAANLYSELFHELVTSSTRVARSS